MGCGRQFCSSCQEEMIHRDHRKHYESASALGQITWREGPAIMGAMDVDLCTERCIGNGGGYKHLLRLVEHKPTDARPLRFSQNHILSLLAKMLDQILKCTDPIHRDLQLDPRSGVFLIRGDLAPSKQGQHPCMFTSAQTVIRVIDEKQVVINPHQDIKEFFNWIFGDVGWKSRKEV